jgi:hypothetical protein
MSKISDTDHETKEKLVRILPKPILRPIGTLSRLSEDRIENFNMIELISLGTTYDPKFLNDKQREIFDYIHANNNHMIVIQAGPGTGKTFTLMSIASVWKNPLAAIIYKHDLLRPFRYYAHLYTVAKFFINVLHLKYFEYKSLEQQLSMNMSGMEFISCILGILNKARMLNFANCLVVLDEYTVIPKPLLLVTLILLKYYKIGTIICGDKNQLQNIHNSAHIKCSSFDIATSFADRTFSLEENKRCVNSNYNSIIEYISRYSSSKRMNDFMYAIVATIFPRQLTTFSLFNDIHLASTHREITQMVHMIVVNNGIKVSFYYIDVTNTRRFQMRHYDPIGIDNDDLLILSNGLVEPSIVTDYRECSAPDKFLPYLPLCEGSLYYIHKHSEYSQAILLEVDTVNEELTMQMMNDGEIVTVGKMPNKDVIFEPHREAILGGINGQIYNYPIYPVNMMSVHKCQGCTITNNLDINLNSSTNQSLYVALSRVKEPQQVTRVLIPNMIDHLASTIVNVPEHANFETITLDVLEKRMLNYTMYHIGDSLKQASSSTFMSSLIDFLEAKDRNKRYEIRNKIIQSVMNEPSTILQCPVIETNFYDLAIHKIMNNHNMFLLLSTVKNDIDRIIWLHEFIANHPEMSMFRENPKLAQSNIVITRIASFNLMYPFDVPTTSYIESMAVNKFKFEVDETTFVLYEVNKNLVATTSTKFCKTIYDKLKETEGTLTIEWLYDALIELTKNNYNQQNYYGITPSSSSVAAASASSSLSLTSTNGILSSIERGDRNFDDHYRYDDDDDDDDDEDDAGKTMSKMFNLTTSRKKLKRY